MALASNICTSLSTSLGSTMLRKQARSVPCTTIFATFPHVTLQHIFSTPLRVRGTLPGQGSRHSNNIRFNVGRVTESQNVRGWKAPLWVTQSNPPVEAGSPTAGCTGPCPGGSSISPEQETPQPPWAACASAPSPSEGRSSSSCSAGTSCASVCACCPLSCHWAPLKRVWPHAPVTSSRPGFHLV